LFATVPTQQGHCLTSHINKARLLALSIAAGRWDKDSPTSRLSRALDGGPPNPGGLAARLMFHFDGSLPPPRPQLITFLYNDKQVRRAWDDPSGQPDQTILLDSPVMGPLPERLLTFALPPLATWKDPRMWLGLADNELAWFADVEERPRRVVEPRLHRYRYRWIPKSAGQRPIEIPKSRLKAIQRQILGQLLNRVPPHPCAHGFRRHRSSLTYVARHLNKEAVLRSTTCSGAWTSRYDPCPGCLRGTSAPAIVRSLAKGRRDGFTRHAPRTRAPFLGDCPPRRPMGALRYSIDQGDRTAFRTAHASGLARRAHRGGMLVLFGDGPASIVANANHLRFAGCRYLTVGEWSDVATIPNI
jgi:hypothetical protein